MRNKRGIWIGLLIFLAFVVSLYYDSYIVKLVPYIHTGFLTDFFYGVAFTSSEIIMFFLLTGLFLWSENKRKWILPLGFTLLISSIVGFVLKIVVQRPRPFQLGLIDLPAIFIKDSFYIWDFSFPSGQTILAFCALPILSKEFPKLKWVWLALAILIGASRVYFGFHFLSDVIAGGLIGYLIGAIIVRIEKENKFWERIYRRIHDRFMR